MRTLWAALTEALPPDQGAIHSEQSNCRMKALKEHRRLVLAKVPSLIREALRQFRRLTGFVAVPALRPLAAADATHDVPLPPVHPRCAVLLRKATRKPPCEDEWHKHLQFGAFPARQAIPAT